MERSGRIIMRVDDRVTLLAAGSTMKKECAILNSLDPSFTQYMSPRAA
jgi:hypothetical protein